MMNIRLLQENDAEAFRHVRLQALREHPEAFGASFEEERERTHVEWEGRLRPSLNGEHGYFGAFEAEELVGIIGFYRHRGAKVSHKATIVSLYVKPESRGKGVAAQLVEAVIAYIRERTSVEQLQLSVVTVNRAARMLYERIGFTLYGEEKDALKVGERYYDEYHMVLPLNEKKGTE